MIQRRIQNLNIRPALRRSVVALALGAAATAAALVPPAAQARISQLTDLFAFGDSLSDGGNSGLLTTPPFPSPGFPPRPYAGGRASNGKVAVEYLWDQFNPGNTSFKPSLAGGTNYALVGASTGLANYNSVWSLPRILGLGPRFANQGVSTQLQAFLSRPADSFDPASSLFVVWLFPNDLFYWRDAPFPPGNPSLTAGLSPGNFDGTADPPLPIDEDALVANALGNVQGIVQTLAASRARNFLIPNIPDLGSIPEYRSSPSAADYTRITQKFNAGLATVLQQLGTTLPGVDLTLVDTYSFLAGVQNNPAAFGFQNATDRCLTNVIVVCADPSSYLFWDGSHPTTAGHRALGTAFFNAVAAPVPGPLPLLGAAAAFGWSRRLRRRLGRPAAGLRGHRQA